MASPGGVHMGIASSDGTSLDNFIQLDTDLILSWANNWMTFNFKRTISSPGSIIKVYDPADQGTHLQLHAVTNTYSGGTIFKSGNLAVWQSGGLARWALARLHSAAPSPPPPSGPARSPPSKPHAQPPWH